MSYTVKVRVRDGRIVGTSSSGDLPDGVFVVNGHSDTAYTSIAVQRHGADGQFAETAQHTHYTEAYAGSNLDMRVVDEELGIARLED